MITEALAMLLIIPFFLIVIYLYDKVMNSVDKDDDPMNGCF